MQVWIPWLASILFGYFAVVSSYAGLKHYNKEEKREFNEAFSYGEGILAVMGLLIAFVLTVSEKLFPERYQLLVFRIIALLTSLLMFGLVFLVWYLYFH